MRSICQYLDFLLLMMAPTQIRGGASQRSEPWLLSSGVGRGPLLFAASASESQSADDLVKMWNEGGFC